MVVMCDFSGFQEPEMVKRRPVVVLSPRRRRGPGLFTVVPLSATVPNPVEPYHYRLHQASLPGEFGAKETWVKGDMLYTVSIRRLDRIKVGPLADGTRQYAIGRLTPDDWRATQRCVLAGLGLDHNWTNRDNPRRSR